MEKSIFAFLDLLGFSNYVSIDIGGAVSLLNDYHLILSSKLYDNEVSPCESYGKEKLKNIAQDNYVNSFDNFIPFSDSIFITSRNPDLFLKQICNFLTESFLINSYEYRSDNNEKEITRVEIKEFSINRGSGINITNNTVNWFPVLFRGGITYGEIIPAEMTCIRNSTHLKIPSIIGKVVVEAVKLEKTDKGPRLFCNKIFVDNLSNETKHFILPLNNPDLFEILWPMSNYIDSNDCKVEINSFMNLFIPALNLWKAFNHLDFGTHYYKFIKLVVISTIKYFEYRKYSAEVEKYIAEKLRHYGLEQKINDLMKSSYI